MENPRFLSRGFQTQVGSRSWVRPRGRTELGRGPPSALRPSPARGCVKRPLGPESRLTGPHPGCWGDPGRHKAMTGLPPHDRLGSALGVLTQTCHRPCASGPCPLVSVPGRVTGTPGRCGPPDTTPCAGTHLTLCSHLACLVRPHWFQDITCPAPSCHQTFAPP